MKVKEFIEKLEKVPQDVDVVLIGYTWYKDECNRDNTRMYEGTVETVEYDDRDNKVCVYGEDDEE